MSTPRPDPYAPTVIARTIESVAAGLLAILWVLPLAYAVWAAFHPAEFTTRFALLAPLTLENFERAWAAAPISELIHPLDGDRRFTSATTLTVDCRRAPANDGTGPAAAAARSSAPRSCRSVAARSCASLTMPPSVPAGGVQAGVACTSVLLRIS